MRVYFLRHGPAGDPQAWRGNDFDRPLTPDGHKSVAREAKAIEALDLGIDCIVTSPLVRARQTAEIVAERLKLEKKLVEEPRLGKSFATESLMAILRDRSEARTPMLVGHEPDMSAVIGALIGDARIDLKKGGLACVDLPDASSTHGTLTLLMTPKSLKT